jgi:hypothetical protein
VVLGVGRTADTGRRPLCKPVTIRCASTCRASTCRLQQAAAAVLCASPRLPLSVTLPCRETWIVMDLMDRGTLASAVRRGMFVVDGTLRPVS